tara:strand:+ start:147 stop:299 length:153 start_codon:yes stop_codon:yes gene_type:complete
VVSFILLFRPIENIFFRVTSKKNITKILHPWLKYFKERHAVTDLIKSDGW